MTLKDDLNAAKALIDTPEKLNTLGIVGAIRKATGSTNSEALHAIKAAGVPFGQGMRNLQMVQALFDRAIDAA